MSTQNWILSSTKLLHAFLFLYTLEKGETKSSETTYKETSQTSLYPKKSETAYIKTKDGFPKWVSFSFVRSTHCPQNISCNL